MNYEYINLGLRIWDRAFEKCWYVSAKLHGVTVQVALSGKVSDLYTEISRLESLPGHRLLFSFSYICTGVSF